MMIITTAGEAKRVQDTRINTRVREAFETDIATSQSK